MRFIRESTISTPSLTGSAPPLSPEPAPRATHGHRRGRARAHDRLDLLGRDGSTAAAGEAWYCSSPSDS